MTTNEWLDKETDRIAMELKRREREELRKEYNSPMFLIFILLVIFGMALLFALPVFFFANPSKLTTESFALSLFEIAFIIWSCIGFIFANSSRTFSSVA